MYVKHLLLFDDGLKYFALFDDIERHSGVHEIIFVLLPFGFEGADSPFELNVGPVVEVYIFP